MPRRRRIVVPDVPLHVTQRGNNRCAIFHSRADRALYLALLREGTTRARCALHAYVLMSNHVHLLITPSTATSIADLMHRVSLSYARYFNASYGRTGTLWEGRFKSAPIGSERYFLACSQYIEANPVRAGMVEHPAQHPWTSFHRNALGADDPLVASHAVYSALGPDEARRREAYAALFATHPDPIVIDALRRATARGTPPGGTAGCEAIAGIPPRLGADSRSAGSPRLGRGWSM